MKDRQRRTYEFVYSFVLFMRKNLSEISGQYGGGEGGLSDGEHKAFRGGYLRTTFTQKQNNKDVVVSDF